MSKLSDVVKNDVKKPANDKLVAKVNNIDTSDIVLKNKYNADKTELEKKIPNVTHFIKKEKLVENEFKKLKTFNLSYFIGKSHFEEDGTQNYLLFQLLNKYFKVIAITDYVSS